MLALSATFGSKEEAVCLAWKDSSQRSVWQALAALEAPGFFGSMHFRLACEHAPAGVLPSVDLRRRQMAHQDVERLATGL